MTDHQPIACTLTPGDRDARVTKMAALGGALLGAEHEDGRAVLRFRADAATRARLAALVAAEALCCPFLDLDLELTLSIAGPPEAAPLVEDMAAAFRTPSR